MASTITENDSFSSGEFTPFNDTNGPQIVEAVKTFANTSQGYNTTDIDRFRQGVSITQQKHLYGSSQPKIWSGNIKHNTTVRTIGQARSFVQFDDSIIFKEKPEFDPVWYINDDVFSYPFPIIFNNGPQQEEEAIIEPFTIPMRKNSIDGPYYPRSVKGNLEDGNYFSSLDGAASRVEQFIDYNAPLDPYFFLDEGQEYFGNGFIDSIIVEGFTPVLIRNIDPFDDTRDEEVVRRLQTTDQEFISAVKSLDIDLSEDIRGSFSQKSATAGNIVYGATAAIYGTDSIAYAGEFRGA